MTTPTRTELLGIVQRITQRLDTTQASTVSAGGRLEALAEEFADRFNLIAQELADTGTDSILAETFNELRTRIADLPDNPDGGDPVGELLLGLYVPDSLIGHTPNRGEFLDMFGVLPEHDGGPQGSWAQAFTQPDQTVGDRELSTIELLDQRTIRANLDAAGAGTGRGSAFTQAFLRFPTPVPAARLTAAVTFEQPWDWGNPATGASGKLVGLASHQSGRAPGGGHVGLDNFLVDVIWSGGHGPPVLALYIYAQPSDRRVLPGQTWAKDVNGGHLRQVHIPSFTPTPGEAFTFALDVDAPTGLLRLEINDDLVYDQAVTLLDHSADQIVTHLDFRPVYGGGPEAAPLTHTKTSILLADIDARTVTA